MTKRTTCFGALQLKRSSTVGFGRLLFVLLLGSIFVGSCAESQPWTDTASRSLEDQPLLQHSFTTAPLQNPPDTNMTGNNIRRRRRSSSSSDSKDSALPPKILTASHLSSLRDLLSDKKITVRLGFRVSVTGPSELLDPQLLLSLYKEPGIYNIGGTAGLFSMRVVGIKRVTSIP